MKEQVIRKKIVKFILLIQIFIRHKCTLSLQCKGYILIMNQNYLLFKRDADHRENTMKTNVWKCFHCLIILGPEVCFALKTYNLYI